MIIGAKISSGAPTPSLIAIMFDRPPIQEPERAASPFQICGSRKGWKIASAIGPPITMPTDPASSIAAASGPRRLIAGTSVPITSSSRAHGIR